MSDRTDPTLTTSLEVSPSRPLLARVDTPEELKALAPEELPDYCEQMREFLLEAVPQTGGHLGSNLGVVELTTAIHRVFDLRRDRCIWDVSHQGYPHKIITGRKGRFHTLRQTDGLCGFTNPHESDYDLFHTGHAGTSISLGLGLAVGMAHEPDPPHAISVIGDASLGAGVAFEALNHAGATGHKLIVVLNDNEWSISKSVGSLAKYLSRIRSTRVVQRANQEIHNLLSAIPLIGEKVDRTLEDLGEVIRHAIVPGHVFEELGVTYVGPLNGHDVHSLIENLQRVRELEGPVLLHILTEKGKGHPDGPTHPERVHAAKPNPKPKPNLKKGEPSAKPKGSFESPKIEPQPAEPVVEKGPSYTDAFATALCGAAERDARVHAITAGMPSGTGLHKEFQDRFPSRFHDTGITEQHALALAAGLAKAGMRPCAAIYSTFLQRGYDQIFQEIALQELPVLLCLDRAGPVGQDGPTHNGVFDIAYLRTLPQICLGAPRDATDMQRMIDMSLGLPGPMALRYPRGTCRADEVIHPSERRAMAPGKAEVLREPEGSDALWIWAYGAMVDTALLVAERLARRGVTIGVVDARFAKPLDEDLLAAHARGARNIVTLEDHQRAGGFGSAVLEAWSRVQGARAQVRILGIPDRFLDHMSTREAQLEAAGLDPESVERAVAHLVQPSLV